jgi:hypothetical protein
MLCLLASAFSEGKKISDPEVNVELWLRGLPLPSSCQKKILETIEYTDGDQIFE